MWVLPLAYKYVGGALAARPARALLGQAAPSPCAGPSGARPSHHQRCSAQVHAPKTLALQQAIRAPPLSAPGIKDSRRAGHARRSAPARACTVPASCQQSRRRASQQPADAAPQQPARPLWYSSCMLWPRSRPCSALAAHTHTHTRPACLCSACRHQLPSPRGAMSPPAAPAPLLGAPLPAPVFLLVSSNRTPQIGHVLRSCAAGARRSGCQALAGSCVRASKQLLENAPADSNPLQIVQLCVGLL